MCRCCLLECLFEHDVNFTLPYYRESMTILQTPYADAEVEPSQLYEDTGATRFGSSRFS
jgi:hypothetical protein